MHTPSQNIHAPALEIYNKLLLICGFRHLNRGPSINKYIHPLIRTKISFQYLDIHTEVWKQANRLTRNGCLTELATSNILFSDMRDSTSSLAMMSPFFRALIANTSPVFLYSDNNTYNRFDII